MAHRAETCFFHPELRRLPPPHAENDDVSYIATNVVGHWVRVELTDKRSFCGILEAIDGGLNMIIFNPVEVRPCVGGGVETKGHRGGVMVAGKHVVSIGLYKQKQEASI
jgi:small nuclear ribonucleoprotein (snRNP)-like protein